MNSFLLFGKFTPAFWARLRAEDPALAQAQIREEAARAGWILTHFFFALGEFDFYAVLETGKPADFGMLRHRLMSQGAYIRLQSDPLATFAEMFPSAP